MNPLHEGLDVDNMGIERDRIESVDLTSTKLSNVKDSHADDSHGYSTVATTAGGHGHDDHHNAPPPVSRLPASLQNFLEHIFKLKKRGTTFEVRDCISRCSDFELYCCDPYGSEDSMYHHCHVSTVLFEILTLIEILKALRLCTYNIQ
jgi:hypothetical protein